MTTIVTINASDQITNSRADLNTNFANLNADKIETSYLDTDTTLAANSDVKIATQKAVKTYIDTSGGANASTTVRGIVEEATQSEVDAGTATGGTGARLFVNPSTVASASSTVKGLVHKRKIDINTTEITHGNSTTETNLFSTTIPGGTLGTNNAVRFKIAVSAFDITSGDVNFFLKYGGSAISTITVTAASISPISGYIEGMIVADGATGAQKFLFEVVLSETGMEANGQASVGVSKLSGHLVGPSTVDSTVNQTLAVSVDWSATALQNTITAEFWVVELIS